MSLCECGCGGEAKPGNRYINGHQNRGRKLTEETVQKKLETQRINKEIKEGKRPAPELPFCACGCGGRVTKPGNRFIHGHGRLSKEAKERKRLNKLLKEGKIELPFCKCGCGGRVTKLGNRYIQGHNVRVNNPAKRPEVREKIRNAALGRISWSKGLTKEKDERLRVAGEKQSKTKKILFQSEEGKKIGEKSSRTKKAFFATEEGQQWLDENRRGENSPRYGKGSWCKGETKNTDKRLEKSAENNSKSQKEFFQTEEGKKSAKERGKQKKAFYATEEGQRWQDEHNRGENSPTYEKEPWNKGETKETNESVKKYGEKCSLTKKAFFQTEEGKKLAKEMSKAKKEYYQTDEGLKHRQFLRETLISNLKKGVYNRKPTQLEKDITNIVQNLLPKEYKYNGNFELGITIGGKIPDFVNINGKKKAIDAFGDYWHEGEDPQIRIDLFKEYGWDLLVIWQHELKDKDAVIQKILKFHGVESDYVIPQRTLDVWVDSKDKNENK